ncbi:MAG: chitobiase/beta-hexosaminidase C-terminal domain-containing protein [Candidatus Berkelbacteria bacterium]|nr:chitobiase/beta-hexosaminidase C-terminal domain-containing protein [Candidatus Berkelbacteria bacterium]
MKKFLYKFLVVVLAFGMLIPASLSKVWQPTKAEAAGTSLLAGPNSGATIVDDNSAGSYVWSNPSNAQLSDDQWASATISNSSSRTHYLKATGFGFNIPSGTTINGIVMTIEKHQGCTTTGCTSNVTDDTAKLLKSGSVVGSNLADTTTAWGTADSVSTYGSATNLWGMTPVWTYSDINNVNFGAVFSATRDSGGSRNVYVDQITLKVYYSDIQSPVILAHSDITNVEATSSAGAIVNYTAPNATDNVDATAPAICSPASGSTFPIGTTTVTCNKTDVAGNSATPTTFKVKVVDTTSPTSTVGSDFQGQTYGPNSIPPISGNISGTAADSASGVNSVEVIVKDSTAAPFFDQKNIPVDGSGNWSMVFPAPASDGTADGLYQIKSIAIDNAGNPEANFPDGSGSFVWDSTGPTAPDSSLLEGNYVGPQTVALSDSDPTAVAIYYTTDGTTPDTTSQEYLAPFSISEDTDLEAVAYDAAGNASSAILNISYGIMPVISGESSSSVTTNSATITWTTDNPATSRVVYDTVSHGTLGAAPNFGYAFPTAEDSNLVTNHSVVVSGLLAGTTYYFRTISHGSPENVGGEMSFQTLTVPVVTTAVATIPAKPAAVSSSVASSATSTPAVTTPSTPAPSSEQGQIKGTSTETPAESTEKINWTPWIILFILILLAGAATGGYFYWFGKDDDDDDEKIISEKIVKKNEKPLAKKPEVKKPAVKKKPNRW